MAKRRRTRAGRFIRSKGGKRTAAFVGAGAVTAAVLARRAARRRAGTALSVGANVRAAVTDPVGYYGGLVTGTPARAPRSRAGLLGAKVSTFVQRPFRQTGSALGSLGNLFTGRPTRRRGAQARSRTLVGRVQNLLSFTP